jgi:hypothetical protein
MSTMLIRPAASAVASGRQPVNTSTMPITTYCGTMWYSVTSSDATGNISRGTFIFRTSDLFLMTDLVPAPSVSVNACTTIIPAKMCSAKFGVLRVKPRITPRTMKYVKNRVVGLP